MLNVKSFGTVNAMNLLYMLNRILKLLNLQLDYQQKLPKKIFVLQAIFMRNCECVLWKTIDEFTCYHIFQNDSSVCVREDISKFSQLNCLLRRLVFDLSQLLILNNLRCLT